ncbi:MAG: hypothetical protein ACLRT5_09475 [Lachnospiraceae bacterium]
MGCPGHRIQKALQKWEKWIPSEEQETTGSADIDDPDLAEGAEGSVWRSRFPQKAIYRWRITKTRKKQVTTFPKYVFTYVILFQANLPEMLINTIFLEDSFLIKRQSRGIPEKTGKVKPLIQNTTCQYLP